MLTKRDVMITILTKRTAMRPGISDPEGEEDLFEFRTGEGEEEKTEVMMEGKMLVTSQRCEIIYKESELTGMEGTVTTLGFDLKYPNLISLLRSGSVNTALVFEADRRHVCAYNTPFAFLEVCVESLKVENNLLESGELYLDYNIEIQGAKTEHCQMTFQVK